MPSGPRILIPTIIRPGIVRPVAATVGSSDLPMAAAQQQIFRPMAVSTLGVYDPTGPQHQATGAAASGENVAVQLPLPSCWR